MTSTNQFQSLVQTNFALVRKLNLKTKATILAVLIGTVPVALIGVTAYFTASGTIRQEVADTQTEQAVEILDKLNRFMFDRYGDVQILANLPILGNPKVRAITSVNEKNEVLSRYAETYKVYSSIAVYDLSANLVLSGGKEKAIDNISDRDYFQEPLKTGKPFVSPPQISKITGKLSLFFSTVVKDRDSGKPIYVVRTRMPIEALDDVIINFGRAQDTYHIFDQAGKMFLATEKNQVGKNAFVDIPKVKEIYAKGEKTSFITFDVSNGGNVEQMGGFAKSESFQDLPNLNWSNVYLTETKYAFKAEADLGRTIAIGTLVVAVLVAVLGTWIANQATKPIEAAAEAVEKIGKGELDTSLVVNGEDELAVLSTNINLMAGQLKAFRQDQELELGRIEVARQEARSDADASAQEQKIAKEKLQSRALELLMEVDPISRGNLTIRAQVTDDEIGTIADSYNATVGSLRRIVTQVQTAAQQVTDSTTSSEMSVQELSTEALRQAEEISDALDQVRAMSKSIRTVTSSAEQAEAVVQQAVLTIQEGDTAMNLTVDGILAIQDTVATTSEKVKRLGEASVNISRVVNLISGFAEQTNLLALNAAIEAARAGAQGRGFAVVADEVQALAQQSADATAEIEELVAQIQTGTGEVILAMETGTKQVNTGTRLVGDARKNLTKIADASAQIRTLVAAIAFASTEQSKASDQVTETITDVAAIALNTSTEANQVSNSFKDLLEVAQQLQKSVGQFKV